MLLLIPENLRSAACCLIIIVTGYTVPGWTQPSVAIAPEFIRVIEHPEHGEAIALELSIIRYTHDTSDLTVDLISALHIADNDYYQTLNQRFTKYDALLFELVADIDFNNANLTANQQSAVDPVQPDPEHADSSQPDLPPPVRDNESKGSNFSGISNLQVWMKNALDLEFQLDAINYSAGNFVHADFTPTEFEQSLTDNNESLFTEMLRLWRASILQSLLHPEMNSDLTLLQALFASDRERRLKQQFARQFAQQFSVSNDFDRLLSGTDGSTLVTARNQKAMRILQQQIDKGAQRIGIFYGAAHMPDFHRRLQHEQKLKPKTTEWLQAWDLR